MKKFFVIISIVCNLLIIKIYPQDIFQDNFVYPTGLITQVSGGSWRDFSTNISDIKVVEGNLVFPRYFENEKGNCLYLDAQTNTTKYNIAKYFTPQRTVYVSFLLCVRDSQDLDYVGSTFFNILYGESRKASLSIKKSSRSGYINFGFDKSIYPKIINTDYPINTTLLIIVKYLGLSSVGDDIASLWINPNLGKGEPSPDLAISSGADIDNVNGITFRQPANSGNLTIDAIRVSTTWNDSPLPVELSSFTAALSGGGVILNWKTETEIENHGFDVERKSAGEDWKTLTFIQGYGNSYSPKFYTFNDTEINNSSEYFYRLKQIDNDGSFSYSAEVHVSVNTLNDYKLYQNYPNPFNPVTTIKFYMAEEGKASLTLYNAIGQKIKKIIDEILPAGEHSAELDGFSLGSGIYLCVLEAGGKRKTIKVTFMK